MKKIKILSLVLALVMALAIPTAVFAAEVAEEDSLPDPGTNPDSPFYFMDCWGKQISLVFTFNAENKVQRALSFAEERLAEVEAMAEQNKVQAMECAANEYHNYLEIATQNMEKAMNQGVDISGHVISKISEHLSYLYQRQFAYRIAESQAEDCQQIRQQICEVAQTCQENAFKALASQDPENALQMGVCLMEQACIRVQNLAGQAADEEISEALQQCERFAAMNQELIANGEQIGIGSEAQQRLQQATATQECLLNQIRSQSQTVGEYPRSTETQNQVQAQLGVITAPGGSTDIMTIGSGPMGPAPNSGDGVPDGSGFEIPNGANGSTFRKK
jgi:hypothetical protein